MRVGNAPPADHSSIRGPVMAELQRLCPGTRHHRPPIDNGFIKTSIDGRPFTTRISSARKRRCASSSGNKRSRSRVHGKRRSSAEKRGERYKLEILKSIPMRADLDLRTASG